MKYLRHIAEKVDDWVRLEAQYSNKYAHQLTEMLKVCESDQEFKEIILCSILDRYMFFYTKSNKPTEMTKLMLDELDELNFTMNLPSPRDNELERSIKYLTTNSGLFSVFYKIKFIYGEEGLEDFIMYLYEEFKNNYIPNDDVTNWLIKHKSNYINQSKPWIRKDKTDDSDG